MSGVQLFNGVSEGLARLSEKYKIGIITGRAEKSTLAHLDHFGIRKLIGIVVSGDTTDKGKPNREVIDYALSQLNSPRKSASYAGDSIIDIQTAKNSGIVSIALPTGTTNKNELQAENPDYIFENMNEFFHEVLDGTEN
jgi:phosphoglycolate phosphatase-like HAD superfamily hydrolase